MYEYDGHTTVRPMLIHTNDAELRWNIVHDVGPRTQCAQLVIRCQIAPPCVRAPEATASQAQLDTPPVNATIHAETATSEARRPAAFSVAMRCRFAQRVVLASIETA